MSDSNKASVAPQGVAASSLVDDARAEANMKVLELMVESFHSSTLDPAVRPPVTLGAKRVGRASQSVGLGSRAAQPAGRSPTPAAAAATISRVVGHVNSRIVNLLMQPENADKRQSPCSKAELALLSRMHRSLLTYANRVADDVVLCDGIVEFSDTVPAILADLEAGGARQLQRLIDHDMDLLAELAALGGKAASVPLRQRCRQAQTALGALQENESASKRAKVLQGAAQTASDVYRTVAAEIERLCPRQGGGMLDTLTLTA